MSRSHAVIMAAVLLGGGFLGAQQLATISDSYTAFLMLEPEAKRAHWGQATLEARAAIGQAHASTWLESNEKRLSPGEIDAVRAAIAMLTPEFYGDPNNPDVKARNDTIVKRLNCALWKSDVQAAFQPTRTPPKASWLDDAYAWVRGCLLAD